MSYECIYCDFKVPTKTRLNRHLATQKHMTNFEKCDRQLLFPQFTFLWPSRHREDYNDHKSNYRLSGKIKQ